MRSTRAPAIPCWANSSTAAAKIRARVASGSYGMRHSLNQTVDMVPLRRETWESTNRLNHGGRRMAAAAPAGHMSRRLVLILATACGLAVGNLYYAQPLLPTIAHSLHVSGA